MHVRGIAVALAAACLAGNASADDAPKQAPPPVEQADDEEKPPAPGEGDTIQPGKRPQLKLTGDGKKESPKQEPAADDAPEPRVPTSYQGVTPGAPHLPPRPPKLPVKGPARMTWPGFQIRDGVPTVFLELTSQVEWSVSETPGLLVYTLKDTQVHLRNNQRPLKVGDFGTPVKEVDARPKGKDVRVTIALKKKVAHKERTEEAAGGYKLLLVELSPE